MCIQDGYELTDGYRTSRVPISPERSPEMPRLPDTDPGNEWILQGRPLDGQFVIYKQCPIRKLYDWSKTSKNVLVFDSHDGVTLRDRGHRIPGRLVEGVWQAHIGGDPCPVDPDATMVEVRGYGNLHIAGQFEWWKNDQIYRVTGLVDGYYYD